MPTQEELDMELDTGTRGIAPPQGDEQVYYDSFAAALIKAIGYFVVCEFLIGNTIVEKNGILRSVGVNFITLTDPEANTNTICDMYALKFATVYAVRTKPAQFRHGNVRGGNYQYRGNNTNHQ